MGQDDIKNGVSGQVAMPDSQHVRRPVSGVGGGTVLGTFNLADAARMPDTGLDYLRFILRMMYLMYLHSRSRNVGRVTPEVLRLLLNRFIVAPYVAT